MPAGQSALRTVIRGRVQGVGFRAATVDRALALGVRGWVRNEPDGSVAVHAEGPAEAVARFEAFLGEGPPGAHVDALERSPAKVEGHEQFAVRGVPAGRFVVAEQQGGGYELRLEVDGAWRRWRLSKPPSMIPADKRFASEQATAGADEPGSADAGSAAFDHGLYEQGGRVAWPEAIARGHAVFVLHGALLRGGFALQRTRGEGEGSGWLLIKRRDEHAASR